MTRNLRVLGLALVAAFALSAMVASVASAAPALFTANVHSGKAGIHGGQTGADLLGLGRFVTLTCATATVEGEAVTVGTWSTLVRLNPTYHTCHAVVPIIGTKTSTVKTNGCTYTLNATRNTNSASFGPTPNIATPFSANLHITCPDPNKGIEIHLYNTNNHSDTGAATLCTYDIPPQTINNQIQLTNTATHDILMDIHANVAVTNTITSGLCGNDPNPNAVYEGVDTLTATNSAGVNVGSTVS